MFIVTERFLAISPNSEVRQRRDNMIKRNCLAILIILIMVPTMLGSVEPPYSVDFDLRNMVGFNDNTIIAEDIVAYIQDKYPDSPLLVEEGIGNCFLSAGQSNNVNPAFLVATAELEGRFGTAGWAANNLDCHNTMGYDISDYGPGDWCCVDSWCAMIQRVASVIAIGSNYYTKDRFTVSQVREKYATNPNSEAIAQFMKELYIFSANRNHASLNVPAVDALSIGFPDSSQATSQVTLTLYVRDGSSSGPIIPGAKVTGHDGSGNSFQQTTDSSGYATITGDPGTWSFTASADGYDTNSWDQEIADICTKHAFLQKEQPQESIRTNEYVDNSTVISCVPGTISATCPSADYCVDCEGNCIPLGTDFGRGWSCDRGKWKYQPRSLSDLGTYRTSFIEVSYVPYDLDASMVIANVRYGKGIQLYCNGGTYYYADFNLNGAYSHLSGLAGLDDKTRTYADNVTVTFTGDDSVLQAFELYTGDFPVDVDIDVSGVHKLTVSVFRDHGFHGLVDLINMDLTPNVGRHGVF